MVAPMTFGGLTGPPRGGMPVAIAPPLRPPSAVDADSADGPTLLIADGAAGVISWRLPGAANDELDYGPALGVDSRRAARVPLPGGRRALSLALRPRGTQSAAEHAAPLLACGCARGAIVLLCLDDERMSARPDVARIVDVGGAEDDVTHLLWSADGARLYAAVAGSVAVLAVNRMLRGKTGTADDDSIISDAEPTIL